MEEVDGEGAGFKVVAEDVGVVVLLDGGDALFFLELVDGGELVAEARGGFELLGFGGGHHALGEGALQLGLLAFKKELGIADGLAVGFRRGEAFNAGAEAAVNVVLEAGARVEAGEVDLAGGQQKAAMDELGDAVGEVARENKGRSKRSRLCAGGG